MPVMAGTGAGTPTRRQIELIKAWGIHVIARLSVLPPAHGDGGARRNGDRSRVARHPPARTHLGMEQRELLEDAVGRAGLRLYGTHECGVIAAECQHQRGMHVWRTPSSWRWRTRKPGRIPPDGDKGTVFITTLYKWGAPQIRFNVDDISRLSPRRLSVRQHDAALQRIFGRNDNMVKLRGVNVFPEAIGAASLEDPRSNGEFFCFVDRVGEALTVTMDVWVEVTDSVERSRRLPRGVRTASEGGARGQGAGHAGEQGRPGPLHRHREHVEGQAPDGPARSSGEVSLQTLDRAVAALRLMASAQQDLRLTDVTRSLAISKPTAHRLLAALVEHGLAEQDQETRLYRIGPGIELLGMLTRGTQPDLRSAAMPSVYALAESSGDTVFLVARDRADTVCIARESGSYPIRAITIEVGTRRPLGVGAGGIAILGALERRECERLVAVLAPRLDALPHTTAAQVAKAAEAARRHGHAFSDEQVVRGVRGVSVAIRDVRGSPVAAIGIAAIRERLRRERVQELVERLTAERIQIERELKA